MTLTTSPHVITLQPSGLQLHAQPNETLLTAAIHQGISLPYNCKNGSCGSCKCQALAGQVTQGAHNLRALNEQEATEGWVLACCSFAQSDVQLFAPQAKLGWAPPARKLALRVETVQRLAPDVIQLRLQPLAAQNFEYIAGQYYEVMLRNGSRRAYSVAKAPTPETNTLEFHIRHFPGGLFTDQVFTTLKPGDMLRMEGPFGTFALQEDSARPIVLLATGTGIAPIQALLERLLQLNSTRPVSLYWGGRRPYDLYTQTALQSLCHAMPTLQFVPVLSAAQPEDHWLGRTGHVQEAVLQDFPDLSEHEAYACGSPAMIAAASLSLTTQCGLRDGHFYSDAFTNMAHSSNDSVSASAISEESNPRMPANASMVAVPA